MKIGAKLYILTIGAMLLMACAALVYIVAQLPLQRIDRESKALKDYGEAFKSVQVVANRLDKTLFADGGKRIGQAVEALGTAWKGLGAESGMRALSPSISDAMDNLDSLNELVETDLADLSRAYLGLYEDAKAIRAESSGLRPFDFYTSKDTSQETEVARSKFVADYGQFDASLTTLNDSSDAFSQVLIGLSADIATETARIASFSALISAGAMSLILIATVICAIFLARSIARTIVRLSRSIGQLAEGDLRVNFEAKSRDELGTLARSIQGFVERLDESIKAIAALSERNAQAGDDLASEAESVVTALEGLDAASRTVETHNRGLDSKSGETRKSVEAIGSDIARLDGLITEQGKMLEDSTSATVQMISSIANIARIASSDRELSESLVEDAAEGRNVFSETFQKIGRIAENMDRIEAVTDAIKGIADNTNILAMNAAIQAAHAGAAGSGFAVVAQEIGKLAEASNSSAREISETIRLTVEAVSGARKDSQQAEGLFGVIESKIGRVSSSVSEISQSLSEADTGGRQVLEAMAKLRDAASTIAERSQEMRTGIAVIEQASGGVRATSIELGTQLEALGRISGRINEAAERTKEHSRKVSELAALTSSRISHFVTRKVSGTELELDAVESPELPPAVPTVL